MEEPEQLPHQPTEHAQADDKEKHRKWDAPPSERLPVIDMIRGIAILGILPANIPLYSGVGAGDSFSQDGMPERGIDLLIKALTLFFVDGKMVTTLACLFGVGLAIQADKAWSVGRRFTGRYLWRTFLLFCLGCAHGYLLWFGDILGSYAIIAAVAVLLVRIRGVWLNTIAAMVITATLMFLLTAIVVQSANNESGKKSQLPPTEAEYQALTQLLTEQAAGREEELWEKVKKWYRTTNDKNRQAVPVPTSTEYEELRAVVDNKTLGKNEKWKQIRDWYTAHSEKAKKASPPLAQDIQALRGIIANDTITTSQKFEQIGEWFEAFFTDANLKRVYREGTYAEQLFSRVILYTAILCQAGILFGGDLLACFLFGVWLVRRGFFHDFDGTRELRRTLLRIGLCLGIPLQLFSLGIMLVAAYLEPSNPVGRSLHGLGPLVQILAQPFMAMLYVSLYVSWAISDRLIWLQRCLRCVGQMALTNYLMQSVICTTVFYSYGGGSYGTVDRQYTTAVVAAVWLVELLWSPLYMRVFQIGPVEWVWRSLTDFKIRPLLRERTAIEAGTQTENTPLNH